MTDGVLRLELMRPEKLNAVTTELLEEIAAVVSTVGADGAVRAITLSGAGRGFCSGIDLGSADAKGSLIAANAAVRALRDAPVPVVAMVHGPAVGVGCSLAMACDIVLMARSSYLMLAFTRIGLMPDGGATALVAASAGRARAIRMALLAEKVFADTAVAWGLVAGVVDDDRLQEEGTALAARLAQGPTIAFALTKQAINAASLDELEAALKREAVGQSLLAVTPDFEEGVAAFLAKREPRFAGR
ncbi:enoyl-CoA hydratase-related protein [Dactylosporangium sp. NPDC048998]|uniref:enoyl-CoA hydratase-related protein n=1 Tax=Dactylosporangium sp. NPDC048998 TaxID=3363976 RepID=UPI003722EE99